MQSVKIIILVAVALALFAVLQTAESKSVNDKAEAIEKHVDDEIKKLSKRAAEEDDGGKHKKGKKRKGGGTSTAAPSDGSSTSAAPNGDKSTTKSPGGSTTSGKPKGSSTTTGKPSGSTTAKSKDKSTTKKPHDGSTTKKPHDGSTTKKPHDGSTTGKPDDGSTTVDPNKDKDEAKMKEARRKQNEERTMIRTIFMEVNKWRKWLEDNKRKTLNPKAARVTWEVADKVKKMVNETKPKQFYGAHGW